MKRISNSDLQAGLTCPYHEVKEAYLNYTLKKWLTSKNYGPQSFDEIMALKELCSPEVYKLFCENASEILPKLIANTQGIDFAKVDLLLQNEWKFGENFALAIAYATLINLDTYPSAGLNRMPKVRLVEKMQNVLNKIDNMEVWEFLFTLDKLSPSGLDAFYAWVQNQEKESCLDNSVVRILCEQAKIQARFAKKVFDISLYLMSNFKGFMNEFVEILDDFCSCYPMFRKSLEKFLLKNFDCYFWKLEPFPHRNPLQYYKEMMEHLTSCKLSFSLSWKMKIVQKMLNQAENREIVIYLLDNLKAIYGYQIEDVDEAYLKAIKTGLKKKEVDGSDVLNIVNTMASGPIFGREHWWKNFAQYPLAWQKTMVMVYSSSKLSNDCLPMAYFALVQMDHANPDLFSDFEKLVTKILVKKWVMNRQKIVSVLEVFQDSSYSETTFCYIERGICKLLKIADDNQIKELDGLKKMFPLYANLWKMQELKERLFEIDEKQRLECAREQERKAEIARFMAKLS